MYYKLINEFVKSIQLLCPGYILPSQKTMSGRLLGEIMEALETEMKSELKGKVYSLVEDGWRNIHNEALIASYLHIEGGNFFL